VIFLYNHLIRRQNVLNLLLGLTILENYHVFILENTLFDFKVQKTIHASLRVRYCYNHPDIKLANKEIKIFNC
jgi:hypothetical protein